MNIQDTILANQVPGIWWSRSGTPGIIKVRGQEIKDLIHRLSTNHCLNITQNSGKQTILTNEKGRIIDIIILLQLTDDFLILTSKNNEQVIINWLKKYIIMEDIRFEILTNQIDMMTVHGAESMDCISQLMGTTELNIPMHSIISAKHSESRLAIRCMPIHEMQFLIIDKKDSGLHQIFENSEIPCFDDQRYEMERILSGMGAFQKEINDAFNPLEAGLLHLIDFKKGCYIGQEVIARLDSYNKVQKRLMGFASNDHIPEGSVLIQETKEIGLVTSMYHSDSGTIGLAYIRSEYAYPEATVEVYSDNQEKTCTLLTLPMRT